MRIPRIYFPDKIEIHTSIELDERNLHYITHVLRLKNEMELILFNGTGGEFKGKLKQGKKQVSVEILSHTQTQRESPLKLHLLQGISKGERMDYSIQKAVELGVSMITPINTIRCVTKIKPDRLEKRMQHWQNIIISACEQTGRTHIPKINQPVQWNEYLKAHTKNAASYIFDTDGELSFITALQKEKNRSLTFLIGPEGGLEKEEFQAAESAGFHRVRLGPRTLRTETLAPVVLAIAQSILGDFKP